MPIFYNPFACRQVRFLLGAADPAKMGFGHTKGRQGQFMLVKFYPYNRATCGIQDWIAASRTSSFLYKIATKSFVRWRKHSTHPKGYEDFRCWPAALFSAQYFFEAAIIRLLPAALSVRLGFVAASGSDTDRFAAHLFC